MSESDLPSRTALTERLARAGITQAAALGDLAESGFHISTTRVTGDRLPLGASRLGGNPDLPLGFTWPTWNKRPLGFIAQLDLAALPVPSLPDSGWLLFFYDIVEQPWGFEPDHRGGARVFHVHGARERLRRTPGELPPDITERFAPCALEFRPLLFLPHPADSIVESLGLERDDLDLYDQFQEIETLDRGRGHILLGHPDLVQNDMRGECQLVTSGLSCGDGKAYESARGKKLLETAPAEWQLLLQVDTDEPGPGWMWGDCGALYYWIRRADLAKGNFDTAWLILQCS